MIWYVGFPYAEKLFASLFSNYVGGFPKSDGFFLWIEYTKR